MTDSKAGPSLSLVTVVRNGAGTVLDCLASVALQSHPPEQHVVVDGASTDGTLELLRGWRGHELTISSRRDGGIYDAMNRGVGRVTGDLVGILNADDYYADTDVLARVREAFRDPAIKAVYGDLVYVRVEAPAPAAKMEDGSWKMERVGPAGGEPLPAPAIQVKPAEEARLAARREEDGSRIAGGRGGGGEIGLPEERVVRRWLAGPPGDFRWGWMPPHPTFFVRREVYRQVGGFRRDLASAADYEFILRVLVKHRLKAVYLPGVMVKMRAGGVSNASLHNRWRAHQMDRRAWQVNDLQPYPWTLLAKPLRKLGQWNLTAWRGARKPRGRREAAEEKLRS